MQFCDIFGKKVDASWHMILKDNPAAHAFVLRNLVLIELSGHASPSSLGEGDSKNFRKKYLPWGEGGGERSHNFELKIKAAKFQYKDYFWNN